MTKLTLLPLLLAACCFAGCGPGDALKAHTGEKCVVHFRADYLGMASSSPLPPGVDEVHGASVEMAGVLKGVDADWLTIDAPGTPTGPAKEWVIPREALLLVSFDREKNVHTSD